MAPLPPSPPEQSLLKLELTSLTEQLTSQFHFPQLLRSHSPEMVISCQRKGLAMDQPSSVKIVVGSGSQRHLGQTRTRVVSH